MILRSIKWQLQLWHGVMLTLVLGGFGYTAFELQRMREFRRVDQELHDHMGALLGPLRRPGRHIPPGSPPRRRDGGPEGPDTGAPELEGPPHGPLAGGPPPEIGRDSDAAFPEDGPFYYVVWDREGKIIRSRNKPGEISQPAPKGPRGPILRRGEFHELYQQTPRGEAVLVGRSVVVELKELRNLALLLIGSGAGILALGLVGGWVVATRAMRPIDKISSTAQKIATGDLSQRIAHDESESELGRLVAILNSTFGRLESAFNEQTRFTTDVSHELRTPVSVIVSQTQLALSRERAAPEYRQALEACQRSAQRMRKMIESLMQLARLDAGQEEVRKMEFNLADPVRESVELLQPLAEERQVKLTASLEAVRCVGDPDKITQVVTNLVTNAIHYSPAQGEVRVETRPDGALGLLTVADRGVGIPAEDLPHIFDRFYRVDTSRSRDKGGSGLGLAITRAIVHAHGGTIEAQSKPGEGATFTVRIPTIAKR